MSLFERAGGEPAFTRLIDEFYAGVAQDPLLRPMYPDDLSSAKLHLTLFLIQVFGGPTTYSDQRGHPRLRMRHQTFPIGRRARDAWMTHMIAALATLALDDATREEITQYFDQAASFLMNQPDVHTLE